MTTQFCSKCGTRLDNDAQFCNKCGSRMEANVGIKSQSETTHKSALVTFLLCLFFGVLGIHRFYLGKMITGLLMLLTAGGFGIWVLVDLIFIVSNKFEDKQGNTLILTQNPSPTKKVLLVIGTIAAYLIVFVGTLILVVFYATSGLVDTAKNELSALRAGDYEKSYSYTSKDFQKAVPFNAYKKFINQYPSLKENESSTFNEREIKDNTGMLKGTLTAKDGAKTPILFLFIKEDGAWKILGIRLSVTGAGVDK